MLCRLWIDVVHNGVNHINRTNDIYILSCKRKILKNCKQMERVRLMMFNLCECLWPIASVTFLSESWRDVVGSKIHPKKDFWIIISYLIISDPSCSWCTFHQTLEISFLPVLMTSSFILLRFATFSSSSSSSFNIITFKLQSSIFQQITMKSLLDRQFTTRWWWCSTCIHTYNIPSSLSLTQIDFDSRDMRNSLE